MGAGGVAEFFHRRGRAGADGEGAAVEQRRDGCPASGVGIGTQYNTRDADEQSRCRVGPKILFDRPARDPIPSCIKFSPWGGPYTPSHLTSAKCKPITPAVDKIAFRLPPSH
jgi:hypothetical protein